MLKLTHVFSKEIGIRIPSFGHAGDGNLHVYVCRDDLEKAEWENKLNTAFDKMYRKANELSGLVSGGHGIGFAKKQFMLDTYGKEQIELMRGIKSVFDKKGILNPGKLFEVNYDIKK